MGSGNAHHLFYGYTGASTLVLRMELRCYGGSCPSTGSYQVRMELRNNSSTWTSTSWFTLSDAPHTLEFDWQGSASGSLTLWIDGSQQANLTGINNSTRVVDRVRWGPVGGIDTATRGTYYLDYFESHRASYIGGQRLGLLALVRWLLPAAGAGPATTLSATPLYSGAPTGTGTRTWQVAPTAQRQAKRGLARANALRGLADNGELVTTVITYSYDALYRLTGADYVSAPGWPLDGAYFHYTYDAVGNRLTQEISGMAVTTYTYDLANRLVAVGAQAYTWDANGNLLDDGTSVYAYDAANRLVSVSQGADTYGYTYNGQGDRLSQTVNGVPTYYTLDLAAGLTQVLADGAFTYLYGNGRIAQATLTETAYFLGDALGSVRQLTDDASEVTLARRYEPYGDLLTSTGTETTSYGFTGELFDGSSQLLYLRARYYSGRIGRFVTRDSWPGNLDHPLSFNGWLYSLGDPINRTDPTGNCPTGLECVIIAGVVFIRLYSK